MFDGKASTLLAVVETGSYTKAAQKMNLTQPAVSHQIRLLESEFDIKLFYRAKNKLKLTPQGKILVQYARRAAAVYANACQAIEDSKTETSHLNVGITPTAGETIIPQVLATLCNENPGIHINICMNTIQKIYTRLKAYELDFAVVEGAVPSNDIISTALDTDYLCLAVSPIHRLARARTVSLEDIRHEKLILRTRSAGTRQLFEKHLTARGMDLSEFNVMMELDNVAMIKELVSMDLGITIIAKSACRDECAGGRLAAIPIENSSMVRQIDIVYLKDFMHMEVIETMREIYDKMGN
ncbi:LysR family transcriptional regulator [Lacrimispora sp. 210928-DFI.3.58]|uniref:LysR family transcriptional regulator n=1 Tax=Lacrimispora sp. 210928-DFI.3.58 TaxID=2883214 RepID=UPI0015B77468|nr:LysR family transcriptional regulator [Lacrimispora sp. 210928-DFI.3.58]MCB7317381.1 LysR family transcriptional regulator [Lacrimispora sp. 210928-DFI.3.58]